MEITKEELDAYKLVAKIFNRMAEIYPDLLTDKPLYTEEEVKTLIEQYAIHLYDKGLRMISLVDITNEWWDKHKKK
jgi:hypothetical protein